MKYRERGKEGKERERMGKMEKGQFLYSFFFKRGNFSLPWTGGSSNPAFQPVKCENSKGQSSLTSVFVNFCVYIQIYYYGNMFV